MDKNIKNYCRCYQVLFNKPLRMTDSKLIYGFIIKDDELIHKPLSDKQLLRYIVEGIFGKCLFQEIHKGLFTGENDMIWIDREGNEYKECTVQTRLYSYDAALGEKMNFRCDIVYLEEGEHYWITDPLSYFKQRAIQDDNDFRQGKNQWLENYMRIRERREVLSNSTEKSSENLDYYQQELIKEERFNGKDENWDVQPVNEELPF